jgi:hypothetical protein
MTENILIPLPGFELPDDYPWQIGFVAMVDDQLRRLRATGHFLPPRFFGYYFQGPMPIAIGGSWTVSLDPTRPATLIPEMLDRITHGQYRICSRGPGMNPDYLLVHDRRDGACWLWSFQAGLHFVESVEPTSGGDRDDAEASRLRGL